VTQQIAPLDLHPGQRFAQHHTQAITPDLILTCVGEMWKIEVNEGPLPSFSTACSYEKALEQGCLNSEERAYLRKALHTGKWIRRIVGKRHKTLLEIGRFLLQRQACFFQEGKLMPMTLSDAAEQLQLHESTIARAVTGKYLTCPQGTFALKDFFSQGVKAEAGSVSQHTMRCTLQQLIAKEDKRKPYSDAQLQSQLNNAGIFCARRTVTKYRRLLRLASAAKRKRWVKG
jgi:RNA polymerase sigma-54 factor